MNDLCISSLIVQTLPEMLANVRDRINAMPGAAVYGNSEQGRLVVVLDTPSNRQTADMITDIQNQVDILSATLIYQYGDQPGSRMETRVCAFYEKTLSREMYQASLCFGSDWQFSARQVTTKRQSSCALPPKQSANLLQSQ